MTLINEIEADVLWSQTRFQSGVYECQVTRIGDVGELTVTLTGTVPHVLHREQVKIDTCDTDKWRRTCVEVITDPELRKYP